jgi:hypothetical protein
MLRFQQHPQQAPVRLIIVNEQRDGIRLHGMTQGL